MIICKLMTVVKFMLFHATYKLLQFFLNTLQILQVDCYWLDVHSIGRLNTRPRGVIYLHLMTR